MLTPKNKIFSFLAIILFLAILIANSKNITSPARTKFSDMLSSPLKFLHSLVASAKKIIPFASLREENSALRGRVDLLSRKLEETKTLYNENERLKSLIDFRKTLPYTTIPAEIIGRDPTNWSNSVIIDKGLASGINQNRAVISVKGLVGRVVEVGKYSARILLITDPNSKVGAIIQRNRQGGVLIGRPDGRCKMIYIALDADVIIGDKVITAGFGSIFPKDILIGEVVRVDREPGRLYKNAIVKTSEGMSRLEEVLCIR